VVEHPMIKTGEAVNHWAETGWSRVRMLKPKIASRALSYYDVYL